MPAEGKLGAGLRCRHARARDPQGQPRLPGSINCTATMRDLRERGFLVTFVWHFCTPARGPGPHAFCFLLFAPGSSFSVTARLVCRKASRGRAWQPALTHADSASLCSPRLSLRMCARCPPRVPCPPPPPPWSSGTPRGSSSTSTLRDGVGIGLPLLTGQHVQDADDGQHEWGGVGVGVLQRCYCGHCQRWWRDLATCFTRCPSWQSRLDGAR